MYKRSISPNFVSPAMQVAASQGAAAGIPRGGQLIQPQQDQGMSFNPSQLGGLLGMLKKKDEQNSQNVAENASGAGAGMMNQGNLAQQSGLNGIDYSSGMGSTLGNGVPLGGMGIGAQALQGSPNMGGAQGVGQMFSEGGQFGPDMFRNMFNGFGLGGGSGF